MSEHLPYLRLSLGVGMVDFPSQITTTYSVNE